MIEILFAINKTISFVLIEGIFWFYDLILGNKRSNEEGSYKKDYTDSSNYKRN